MSDPLHNYIAEIQREFARKEAREHAYRPALKQLLESLGDGFHAINDPAHIPAGAPDFAVYKGNIPIGFVEAKDITVDLASIERSNQMERYLNALPNLILTNQLEFRWYLNGKPNGSVRIGDIHNGKIQFDPKAVQELDNLLRPFAIAETKTVSNPRELAGRMAKLAREITIIIEADLTGEKPSQNLQQQYVAFQTTLIPDLSVKQFADMYAQTIAYGLFAARMRWDGLEEFNRMKACWELLPSTNPFLTGLFNQIAGYKLDPPRLSWVVDNLVELMRHTDMEAILKDFGKRTRQEDPVVHFYETFLSEYDPQVRERRGVYYTPEPVVSYIVRSVDHILRERFNRPAGLADPDTLILDPATGTGTFLYFVIQQIYEAMRQDAGFWNQYVADNLLPRIFGFELLMAPYTVAHMKLAMQLQQMGYQFHDRQRLGIYLTNTLEEAIHASERLPFANFITEEANQAAAIKKDNPIMVILGNPPYSGHSANRSRNPQTGELTFIGRLLQDYYQVDGQPLGERNPKWLQDDYVKFIRFAQWRIEKTGYGVLAFITNHGYLDNPTFRGMRQNLMHSFSDIYIINLHGNALRQETAPDGSADENVFDIRQGVAIGICIKEKGKTGIAQVHHIDLWGSRENKYNDLLENSIETTHWNCLKPQSPYYLYTPQNFDLREEYDNCWQITDIFPENSMGVTSGNDGDLISFDSKTLETRFGNPEAIRDIAYRPFDIRKIQYEHRKLARSRQQFTRHLEKQNLALSTLRRPRNQVFDNFFVSETITDKCIISTLDNAQIFPLYLYPDPNQLLHTSEWTPGIGGRVPNLNPAFIREMETKLGLRFTYARTDSVGAGSGALANLDIQNHAAAPDSRPGSFSTPDSFPAAPHSVGAGSRALANLDIQNHAAAPDSRPGSFSTLDSAAPDSRPGSFSTPDSFPAAPHPVGADVKDGAVQPGTAATPNRRPSSALDSDTPDSRPGSFSTPDSFPAAPDSRPGESSHRNDSGTFTPEDIFHYAYAIFHSPTYRARYAEFLKIDFPRLPLTSDVPLFRQLCDYGKSLVELHLMKTPQKTDITFPVAGTATVETRYPRYEPHAGAGGTGTGGFNPLPDHDSPGTGGFNPLFEAAGPLADSTGTGGFNPLPGRVYINPTQYFDGIPADVWEFHIGGYQVLEKWLKDRRGRTLTYQDLQHYKQIVASLQKTIELMDAIDAAIPAWPL